MALSDKKIAKISADIEAGLLTKTKISNKHKINRLTLYNIIERDGLIYGKNKQAINEKVSEKSLERIIEKEVDRATKITGQFLDDLGNHRQLILTVSSAYAKKVKETKNEVTKDDADRIFSSAKINKIVAETLNICYSGARKALGMDRDDDIEKARKIKHGDTDGNSTSKLEERIKEKMKANGFDD